MMYGKKLGGAQEIRHRCIFCNNSEFMQLDAAGIAAASPAYVARSTDRTSKDAGTKARKSGDPYSMHRANTLIHFTSHHSQMTNREFDEAIKMGRLE